MKPLLTGFCLPDSPLADPMATITGFPDWNKKWCRIRSLKGNRVGGVLDGWFAMEQSAHRLWENAAKRGKSFLQGLKPVGSTLFTSALKRRPPKEKAFFAAWEGMWYLLGGSGHRPF